jgi:molybdate transport system substrate-binding protein
MDRARAWRVMIAILTTPWIALAACSAAAMAGPPHADAPSRTLTVAAAANLRFALQEVATRFEAQHRVGLRLVFGSSGLLAAQIEHGAPFDIFFSADESLVSKLVDAGAIARGTARVYAEGRIALWLPVDSPVQETNWSVAVVDPRVRFLAIANPVHAPYGRAAEEALRATGVHARVRPKIVLSDSVDQVLQLVQSGNADAGILAASLAVAPPVIGTGRYRLIPANLHRPIRQALGIVDRTRERDAAAALAAFVTGPAGRAVLSRYGFGTPGGP